MMIQIVRAGKEDAGMIGEAVVAALGPELAGELAGDKEIADVVNLFAVLAAREDSQYSYVNTLKAIDDSGRAMGFSVAYDGARLHEMRLPFYAEAKRILGRDLNGAMGEECTPAEFYLDSLAVFPAFRGMGVARALIEATAMRAAGSGKPLGLLCDKSNSRARRLYDSLGFHRVGETYFAGELMDHMQRGCDSQQ